MEAYGYEVLFVESVNSHEEKDDRWPQHSTVSMVCWRPKLYDRPL